MRAPTVWITATLFAVTLLSLAPSASAQDPVCVPVPNGNHLHEVCADVRKCTAFGFCIDTSDPKGTASGLRQWVVDQLTCTCPPL